MNCQKNKLIRFFEKMVTRSATHFFKKDESAYFVYSLRGAPVRLIGTGAPLSFFNVLQFVFLFFGAVRIR